MAITFTGTTGTFSDGSTQTGSYPAGVTTPDTNTANNAQSFNIGHLILANCIFSANTVGYEPGGYMFWALNSANSYYHIYAGTVNLAPAANTTVTFPVNESRHGSQSYFARGNGSGTGTLSGTWKARGQACGAGINQTNGYFVLMERVA
jgi:hypothetical protein